MKNWPGRHGTDRGGRGGNNRQREEPTRAKHQIKESGALSDPGRNTVEAEKPMRRTDRSNKQKAESPIGRRPKGTQNRKRDSGRQITSGE